MRTALLLISTCIIAACSPNYTQTVKSPDDLLAEQEALAVEQEKKSKEHEAMGPSGSEVTTDSEQAAKFDERQTEMEISRAVRSAETCPGVSGAGPYGEAKVSITFQNDGHVASDKSTITAPFEGTPNGDCVLRALNAIITKNFVGQPVTKEITVKLDKPAEAPKEKEKKSKAK